MGDWIDITMPFGSAAGTWPGDAPFEIEWTSKLAKPKGSLGVNLSRFCSSPHNGTHSDAPYHVLADGPKSEALELDAFIGPCRVVDATRGGRSLDAEWCSPAMASGNRRILFKTNGRDVADAFPQDFGGLSPLLAAALAQAGARLVGTDAPSVDPLGSPGLPAHVALFNGGAALLENLDLSKAAAGDYEIVALPLKVAGLCAAPVRAILRPAKPLK